MVYRLCICCFFIRQYLALLSDMLCVIMCPHGVPCQGEYIRCVVFTDMFLLLLAVWLSASPAYSRFSPCGLRPLRSIRVISYSLRLRYCFALSRCVSLPMGYFVCFYSQFLSLLGCVLTVRPVRGITRSRKLAVFCYCK